jgi:hypothetical protein
VREEHLNRPRVRDRDDVRRVGQALQPRHARSRSSRYDSPRRGRQKRLGAPRLPFGQRGALGERAALEDAEVEFAEPRVLNRLVLGKRERRGPPGARGGSYRAAARPRRNGGRARAPESPRQRRAARRCVPARAPRGSRT